ncbi:LPP20 family lipoprotein [Corallococcus sp. 4LFB]|uniref:LPP20 family lipoprotein n=1 Tax=Corallococcus sp. 4LFB TaxID=3383249 RepID=UPI003976545E
MRRSLWGLLLVVPLAALGQGKDAKVAAPAAGAVRGVGTPGINWEGQVLRATGAGAPDLKAANPGQARLGAERAAKQDAFRNLMEQARGIQVSAGRTVGDELARDEVKGRVEGAIRGYKVLATRYFSDSGVEMDVEVPLAALAAALTPAQEPAIVLNDGAAKYTGLVVDARGLGVTPVLAPGWWTRRARRSTARRCSRKRRAARRASRPGSTAWTPPGRPRAWATSPWW